MYQRYDDIASRIAEEPTWFDEHAVPRYCKFEPYKIANIYAREAALAEVNCQMCQRVFRVAFSEINWNAERVAKRKFLFRVPEMNWNSGSIADAIRTRTLHFGDPPNACCDAGASANSEPRRVIEYWSRHDPTYTRSKGNQTVVTDVAAWIKWVRDPALEIDIGWTNP